MRNKYKQILKKRHEAFKEHLKIAYDYFESLYPGWQTGDKKDVDHIKKRLRQVAKQWQNNPKKKKTKILYKKDFKNWPFTQDSVIIIQTSKLWISCIIGVQEYALNGLAQSALKLKAAHDAGVAIKGKSISEFIQIGLKL